MLWQEAAEPGIEPKATEDPGQGVPLSCWRRPRRVTSPQLEPAADESRSRLGKPRLPYHTRRTLAPVEIHEIELSEVLTGCLTTTAPCGSEEVTVSLRCRWICLRFSDG